MLEGFVVPHAHFRVFQGRAPDALALLFQPQAAAFPTDLHLREFAQLEAQVKALQQQLQSQQSQPPAHPSAKLSTTAASASLAECLSFYARLMTPESFPWPDFLAIVVAKLTEHFVVRHVDSELVRRTVLDVFRGSRAHLAQVGDGAKTVTLLRGLLGQHNATASRVWALRLLETMPSLAKDDTSVRTSLLAALKSPHTDETKAAIDAVWAFLPHSRDLRATVVAHVQTSNSPVALASLLPLTIERGDEIAAEKAWNYSASLFHDQVDDDDALLCLCAAGAIASKFPGKMLARHLQLVRYIVVNDPRPLVVANVWTTCESAVRMVADEPARSCLWDVMMTQLKRSSVETRASATGVLQALCQLCKIHGRPSVEVVNLARKLSAKSPRDRHLFVVILSHCVGSKVDQLSDPATHGYLTELVQQLGATHFARDRKTWDHVVDTFKSLVHKFPDQFADSVSQCYAQLIRHARRKRLVDMERALWLALSRLGVHCRSAITGSADLLAYEVIGAFDEKTKQAIAVCLVFAADEDPSSEWMSLCLRLTDTSATSRYDVARVALCCGASQYAGRLLASLVDVVDHECFGSWLRALATTCETDVMIKSDRTVSLSALHQLLQARALLQAVESATNRMDFQIEFVAARLGWMELMLQAQQYAAELAHTNRQGGVRERRLSEAFHANAEMFLVLRSKLWCATPGDHDVVLFHTQLCELLGNATMELLVQDAATKQSSIDAAGSALDQNQRALSSLKSDLSAKAERLQALDRSRRPVVGSTIFAQLLGAVCLLPSPIPRQFFRSQSRPERRVRCSMQFLTQAEATSYSSKPRARSQLGVALGTEFASSLHGAVGLPRSSALRKQVKAVHIKIRLVNEKAEASAAEQSVLETTVPLPVLADDDCDEVAHVSGDLVYWPITVPVLVPSELLGAKGTYSIEAAAFAVDTSGAVWQLASTGGRRGIIVY